MEIIDIVSSLKMEHISTTLRGRAYSTGANIIHRICIGEGDDVGSGNGAVNAASFIVLSSSSLHLKSDMSREGFMVCCGRGTRLIPVQ